MPSLQIPLFTKLHKAVDKVALTKQQEEVIDCFFDEVSENEIACSVRPGLDWFLDTGLGVNKPIWGGYWWEEKQCGIVITDGKIFKVTYVGGIGYATNMGGVTLAVGLPVSFATDGNVLLMANGGRMVFTDGTSTPAFIVDADAPTNVSHVAFIDGYFLANKLGTNQWFYCDILSPSSWQASSFFRAIGEGDLLVGVFVFSGDILLFGTRSLEIWYNDETSPFNRRPGALFPIGTSAPFSIVFSDEGAYFLDNNKHFCAYENEKLTRISTPYDTEIEKYSSVSDCIGHRMDMCGRTFFIWSFPAADRTIAYDLTTDRWYRWGHWNGMIADYERFIGQCYFFSPAWGFHVIGDRRKSTLHKIGPEFFDDAGEAIRMLVRSGRVDYGTMKTKRCRGIRMVAKRGSIVTTTPVMRLRFQDDGEPWSNWINMSLGNTGELEPMLKTDPTGMFANRRYEVSCSDSVPRVFMNPEHDVDVLSR